MSLFNKAQDMYKTNQADRAERKRLDRIAAAEAARLRAIRQRAANESEAAVLSLIADHNAQHGSYARIVLASDLPTTKKCGNWTLVSDCEDSNCYRHYEEKKEMASKATYPKTPADVTAQDLFDSLFKS